MQNDDKILHIISNETKDSINTMSIVTPSVYTSLFSKYASKHNTDLKNEQEYAKNIIQEECQTLTLLQENTSTNISNLSHSTIKAISAIKEKDESKLSEVLKETQELRLEIEKLKEAIYKDELTNTFNRKWLHDNYVYSDENHFKESGTLAIVDLNYFKLVNDTYGHVIGDKVLIFIANKLKLSKYDVVRYGGDEFIILFPQKIDLEQASELLNKIRENVIAQKLKAHSAMFRTSFSIGITQYNKDDSLESSIEKADKNMYIDKEKIKKRITGIEV